ncbi:DedA family protein [soil metagenome]
MTEWITDAIDHMGYMGIAFLMFVENIFPPIPSEVIMPAAGFTAARGDLAFAGVILAGRIGSLLGALPWYYAGRWLGGERLKRFAAHHGRWLSISGSEMEKALSWFDRHGGKAVFVGRVVPTVRTLISVPAGIVHMKFWKFIAWSAAGTMLWTGVLAWGGLILGDQYGKVKAYLGPVSIAVIALIVLVYIYRVLTFEPDD